MIDALKRAFGLEAALFEQHRATFDSVSREEVYAHYRTGFSEQLAQQLTDYSWQAGGLRAADRALAVPDSVGVLELKAAQAQVAWITPSDFRIQWSVPRCEVDRTVREDGRWIVQARGS